MNNIDWDRLQEQYDEQMPGCPWLDDDDEPTREEKDECKVDMEEY